jgi:uracil-DNA glycosylase family 4
MVRSVPAEFSPALDVVLTALEQMRDRGGKLPRASRVSLTQLHRPPVPAPAQESIAALSRTGMLAAIQERVAVCVKCPHLAQSRTQTVFGVGNPNAELMFVGEAPGADEDARGEPFVGAAGQLLTKIIAAMGFTRTDVYIANVLKCRPDTPGQSSGNRKPTAHEMQTCLPYLAEQIEIIKPKVLVALGGTAVEGLLGIRAPVGAMRGRWHSHQETPLMITYHPSYLLRNQSPADKRKVWEDMLQVLERLDRPISEKQRNYFRTSGE